MEESKGVGRSGGAAMAHETVPTINTTTNNHKTLTHVVQQDNNITNRNSSSHNYYTGFVDEKKLVPIVGVCCFLFSFYSEYPHCIGFSSKNSILCAKNRVVFLKPGRNTEGCCVCLAVECLFIHFDTVCKSRSQLCCLDCGVAIPPDDEVPCSLVVFGCTVFFKDRFLCRCCNTFKAMIDE